MQLYTVIGEVLAIQIRKNSSIKGLRLPGKVTDLKLSLYADDLNNIVTTQHSIVHLFRELHRFELASGCNINHEKTQGLLIGGAIQPTLPYRIEWNPIEGMKVLGIYFFPEFKTTQNYTWKIVTRKIKNRSEILSSRDLSMQGRGIIVNSLLLSKAWHVASVIPPTETVIQQINMIIFKYIYNYKEPHTIAHQELTLPIQQGGIGVLDLKIQQKALRISKLKHILDPLNDLSWLVIPRLYTASTITRYNTEWPFLASPDTPRIDFQDPINSHLSIPEHLYDIIKILKDHKRAYRNLKDPTTRCIYKILIKHKHSITKITGEAYWNTALGYTLPWNRIWQTTFQSLYKTKHLDIYYKFLHNALPSGYKLRHSQGRYNINCARCHILETPLHMFATCPYARDTWNRYHYIYAHFLQHVQIHYQIALFAQQLPPDKHQSKLLLTITNIILSELWRARCQHKFNHIPTNSDTSTYIINARIKQIHYAYLQKSPNHVRQLCIPSPICTLDHNRTPIFHLPDAPVPEQDNDSDETSEDSS